MYDIDKDEEEEEQGHQVNAFSRQLLSDCDSDNETDSRGHKSHNRDEENEDFMGFQSY